MDSSFEVLKEAAEGIYIPSSIDRIPCPSSLVFCRDYVSMNRPVIITGALKRWKAMQRWSNAYLRKKLQHSQIHVAQTPDGRADAIKDGMFVKPLETLMPFPSFLDCLQQPPQTQQHQQQSDNKGDDGRRVYYAQHQNGSFHLEYPELHQDICDDDLQWAFDAFGTSPDAVNFWYGTDDSVTSLHKDPYENIYCVVAGTKLFTLLPPTDLPYLYQTQMPSATYVESEIDRKLAIQRDDPPSHVPWIQVDPDCPDLHNFPRAQHIHPLHCEVHAGEVLYLPSLWYHKVAQRGDDEGRTIAVNYWCDM
eukprot:TRINITY_DN5033_c0_g1_i1.p1 TRINITY_DN5033_c0_g1~~TRINITY_DN5033_c0_g1_i1.p1  ORF type:complete len:306 (+),score=52.74 TRINITY_DN5033_c0_g1_i1:136-1053(+)